MASPRALTITAVLLGASLGTGLALLERGPETKPAAPVARPRPQPAAAEQAARPATPASVAARGPIQPAAQPDPQPVPTAAAKRERSEPIPYDLSPLPDAESVQAAERACGGADLARECVRAAVAYASGAVVARNQKKVGIYNHRAHQLFEQACERRDAEACYALAWLYANGRGVMRSGEVAMNMFVRTLGLCRTRRQAICERLGETPP